MTFALASIPMIGAIGAAVDYSRANSARTAMQAALDSTALILSKDAQTLTNGSAQRKGEGDLPCQFPSPGRQNITVTPVLHDTAAQAASRFR